MAGLWTDLRSALRQLRRARGWSLAVVATLALGIGASCAVFSLAYAALLRPLPFTHAARLVWVSTFNPQLGLTGQAAVSQNQLQDWKKPLGGVFTSYAWLTTSSDDNSFLINGLASSPYVRGASTNLFSVLGVQPELGRLFRPSDATPGHDRVAVISDVLWRSAYGASPAAIGKSISDEQTAYTIVGVLPASFRLDRPTGIWLPDTPIAQLANFRRFYLVGRRRAGASLAETRVALKTLRAAGPAAVRPAQYWGRNSQWRLQVKTLRAELSGPWQLPLTLLLLAVGCLLLVACVNAANLLLGRIRQREHEVAIRLALGCSRARLARWLLLEAAALSALAGAAGWALAVLGLDALRIWGAYLLPAETLRQLSDLDAGGVNAAVLGFSAVLSAAIVIAVSLGPALQAAGFRLTSRLRSERRSRAASTWLVAGEAAMATLLVVAAGLLVHSFLDLSSVNPGFDPSRRISFDLDMPIARCTKRPCASETAMATAYFSDLHARLRALPGVAAVAEVGGVPLSANNATSGSAPVITQLSGVFPQQVSPGYLPLIGAQMLQGRAFNSGDITGRPKVIIVNQAFANAFFPGQNVIGRHVHAARCDLDNPDPAGCTIVGVLANIHESNLAKAPEPAIYESYAQDPVWETTFVVRTAVAAKAVMPELEEVVRHLPDFAGQRPLAFAPRTLNQTVALSVASPRFRTWLASLLAGLALALAAFGIYAVQTYAVARRRHEIGVRMTLGAAPAGVLRMIVGEAIGWALLGAAIGLAAGLAAGRLLSGLLFQVPSWDPATMLGAPALLVLVAAAAAYVPARRAMRINPVEALRAE
jgi:predicted permease